MNNIFFEKDSLSYSYLLIKFSKGKKEVNLFKEMDTHHEEKNDEIQLKSIKLIHFIFQAPFYFWWILQNSI